MQAFLFPVIGVLCFWQMAEYRRMAQKLTFCDRQRINRQYIDFKSHSRVLAVSLFDHSQVLCHFDPNLKLCHIQKSLVLTICHFTNSTPTQNSSHS